MPVRSVNNVFTKGELDPSLYSRVDLDLYTKGARRLRNMISLWGGSARIAPGSLFIDSIVDRENGNSPITNYEHIKGVEFLFDIQQEVNYTIILRSSGSRSAIDIYFNGVRVATVSTIPGPNPLPYTPAQIKDVHFTVGHDRVLLLHENVPIYQLRRTGGHGSWSLTLFNITIFPTFDYSTIGKATDYSSFTFTLGATSGSGISLTSSSSVFTANHVGGLFVAKGGVARITAVASGTSATVNILDTFSGTSIAGTEVLGLREKMWTSGGGSPSGANRGWPSRGIFYLNRLVLGRSLENKNVCALSTAGVYNNFDDSELDEFASFSVSFNGRGEQSIQSIVADDSIIFLTTNKVFAQNPLFEESLSALNFYFAPQSQNPASSYEAQTLDNQVLYINGNKTQVIQLIYSTGDAKYMGYPSSLLSAHLFQSLNSNATWEPENIQARLYMATQENGSMLFYNTLIQQNVSAWSLRTTRGNFRQVIGDGRQAHVIVEREINLGSSTFESNADYAFLSDPTFKGFYDATSFFNTAVNTITVFESEGDYIVLGDKIPFTAINIILNTVASEDCELTFEYLDNNGFWDTFTPTDNTSGFTSSDTITWSFDDVLNWFPNTVNGIEDKYWIRIRRNAETVNTLPVIEEIEINTGIRIYLEQLDFNEYTDSTVVETSDANGNVTGLAHLAGSQVYAIEQFSGRDFGATSGPYFVNESGETVINNKSAVVKIGIQYKPLLIPMPLFTPTMEGDNIYSQKYVQDLFIDYIDSLYLQAGEESKISDIPIIPLGNYTLGQPVEPQSGIYTIHPRGDWSPRQEIIITQSQPGPMTIIGVGYRVEVT